MIRFSAGASSTVSPESSLVLFSFLRSAPSGASLFGSLSSKAFTAAKRDGFTGAREQLFMVRPDHPGMPRVFLVGLGDEEKCSGEVVRRALASVVRKAATLPLRDLSVRLPDFLDPETLAQAATEGASLGAYRFTEFQSKSENGSKLNSIRFAVKNDRERAAVSAGIRRGEVFAETAALVRNWGNTPPSDMDPAALVKQAQLASRKGFRIKILDHAAMRRRGMGAILGVNRGSARPPFFLHMTYTPKGKAKRRIGLCGKGITFDSGGLSLKPAKSMETMKLDMCGAATVIAIMRAVAVLKPNVEVHGFTPLTENMPANDAVKPGDVLKTMDGKTIEVLNTDAEGRLVLSDTLRYACRQKLDEIIDVATLTGACSIALGPNIAGIMGTDQNLLGRIKQAAEAAGEKVWELPLEAEYLPMLKSHVADIKNIGTAGQAGTIIGGLFLKEFVDEGMPWAHVDIASVAWSDSGTALAPAGATGALVRTLLTHVLSYN